MSAESAATRGGDPFDGQLGVEQPRSQLFAGNPRPERGGVGLVFDLALHHQGGFVEPDGAGAHAPAAPFVEPAGAHRFGGGVDDDRHPGPQRPNGGAQHAFGSVGQDVCAHDEGAQRSDQDRPDQPGQLRNAGSQIEGEEIGHERDHAQRPAAGPEAADVHRGEDDGDENGVAGDGVRREQRGGGDG
jgi:hypothetical protein